MRHQRSTKHAFTLVELLVSIVVIAMLIGLLLVGLSQAARIARKNAAQQTVRSIGVAVREFEKEFGFFPPLVYDGVPQNGDPPAQLTELGFGQNDAPIYTFRDKRIVAVYSATKDVEFLRGPSGGASVFGGSNSERYRDPRYSNCTLAIYLAGALGENVDGVEGPGFVKPSRDGSFQFAGSTIGAARSRYDALLDVGKKSLRMVRGYLRSDECDEFGTPFNPSDNNPERVALVDSNDIAYRYYRWEPDENVTATGGLNIPIVLVDPILAASAQNDPNIDVTESDPELRSARWAVVGAGANGVFGTEDITVIYARLGLPSSTSEEIARQIAWKDNLVELGR